MEEPKEPEKVELKLYELLVDQYQKKETVLWQLPTAFLAINAVAIERLTARPRVMLLLFLFDVALTYAYCRVVIQQGRIAKASEAAETYFQAKGYGKFIPIFSRTCVKGAWVLVAALVSVSLALAAYALSHLCTCH